MFDISLEQPIPLAEACRLVPAGRSGQKTHISTLVRWIRKGAKSLAGETVRLEAIRLGSRWLTSREALQRFAERLTPTPDSSTPAPPRTPTQRSRASERAARELEAIGI